MNQIIIFIKNPESGKVKTRLAASVGNEKSLTIYLHLLNITRREVIKLNATRHLYYSEYIEEKDEWDENLFIKRQQCKGDLGERMLDAFQSVFDNSLSNEISKVIIIGSDCAELTGDIISDAFNLLDNFDVVVGPSYDGGYYLLGMKNIQTELFENLSWSTEKVFPETIKIIMDNSLSYALLPLLNDIDLPEDWTEELERQLSGL